MIFSTQLLDKQVLYDVVTKSWYRSVNLSILLESFFYLPQTLGRVSNFFSHGVSRYSPLPFLIQYFVVSPHWYWSSLGRTDLVTFTRVWTDLCKTKMLVLFPLPFFLPITRLLITHTLVNTDSI